MEKAGWVLIWTGVVLIVAQSIINWVVLIKERPAANPTDGMVRALNIGLPNVKDIAELLKAPHGPAIALVITGAVLLLASAGVDVSFGTSTAPSPTQTATP